MKVSLLSDNIKEKLLEELHFQATRSSGKGGQNVNKVSSKIIVTFNIVDSEVLNSEQKTLLHENLASRISLNGTLQVTCSKERSQYMNKKHAIEKFYLLIDKALKVADERKATKPTRQSKENRLKEKQIVSEIKQTRSFKLKDIE